jgi:hypothetical protein
MFKQLRCLWATPSRRVARSIGAGNRLAVEVLEARTLPNAGGLALPLPTASAPPASSDRISESRGAGFSDSSFGPGNVSLTAAPSGEDSVDAAGDPDSEIIGPSFKVPLRHGFAMLGNAIGSIASALQAPDGGAAAQVPWVDAGMPTAPAAPACHTPAPAATIPNYLDAVSIRDVASSADVAQFPPPALTAAPAQTTLPPADAVRRLPAYLAMTEPGKADAPAASQSLTPRSPPVADATAAASESPGRILTRLGESGSVAASRDGDREFGSDGTIDTPEAVVSAAVAKACESPSGRDPERLPQSAADIGGRDYPWQNADRAFATLDQKESAIDIPAPASLANWKRWTLYLSIVATQSATARAVCSSVVSARTGRRRSELQA